MVSRLCAACQGERGRKKEVIKEYSINHISNDDYVVRRVKVRNIDTDAHAQRGTERERHRNRERKTETEAERDRRVID